MHFYTNFHLRGSTLYVREVNGDRRYVERYKVKPTLFIPTDKESEASFKTLFDQPLAPVEFDSVKEAKEFIERYSESTGVYGFNRWAYNVIDEKFPGNKIEGDFSKVRILFTDIETECEDGFPNVFEADKAINAIDVYYNGKHYSLGLEPIPKDTLEGYDAVYKHCSSEYELLKTFVELWEKIDPDIITGWNSDMFDYPYLAKRIQVVLGEEMMQRLCTLGIRNGVNLRERKLGNRVMPAVSIEGVTMIDYIDIYKKFKMKLQESYKLDHIAYVELGERKLEYDGPLHLLYTQNYPKFIRYNVKDVDLIVRLEEKLSYIKLAVKTAWITKTSFSDVFSPVRTWDVIIANFLRGDGIQGPSNSVSIPSSGKYEGAYVMDPNVGLYDWVCSFDLTSLYPSLIRTYNISPEVDIRASISDSVEDLPGEIDSDFIVNQSDIVKSKITPYLIENDLSMASNGQLFKRDKKGFLNELMGTYFEMRKAAKKEMLKASDEIQKINAALEKL